LIGKRVRIVWIWTSDKTISVEYNGFYAGEFPWEVIEKNQEDKLIRVTKGIKPHKGMCSLHEDPDTYRQSFNRFLPTKNMPYFLANEMLPAYETRQFTQNNRFCEMKEPWRGAKGKIK